MEDLLLNKDIEMLKTICQELEDNEANDEWDLCDLHRLELSRITGFEDYDWDKDNLAYFIDGMQRALHLIEVK